MLLSLKIFFSLFCMSMNGYAEEAFLPKILYSNQSPFGLIEVVTTRTPEVLNVCENKEYSSAHSTLIKGDITYLGTEYQPFVTVGFCFLKEIKNALLLGLGAGEYLSYLKYYFSEINIDVIEINPVMIDIVEKFREIDKSKVNFIINDAFKYVAVTSQCYDLIFCDVYFCKPSTIREYKGFFANVKNCLNENGVFIWNAYIPFIPKEIIEDMFRQFDHVMAASTKIDPNIIFICYQGDKKAEQELTEVAKKMQFKYNFRYALPDLINEFKYISPLEKQEWVSKFPQLY